MKWMFYLDSADDPDTKSKVAETNAANLNQNDLDKTSNVPDKDIINPNIKECEGVVTIDLKSLADSTRGGEEVMCNGHESQDSTTIVNKNFNSTDISDDQKVLDNDPSCDSNENTTEDVAEANDEMEEGSEESRNVQDRRSHSPGDDQSQSPSEKSNSSGKGRESDQSQSSSGKSKIGLGVQFCRSENNRI